MEVTMMADDETLNPKRGSLTVRELIEQLEKWPPEKEVFFDREGMALCNIEGLEEVSMHTGEGVTPILALWGTC